MSLVYAPIGFIKGEEIVLAQRFIIGKEIFYAFASGKVRKNIVPLPGTLSALILP